MSVLFRGSRPIIAFDVENPDHRRWFAEFVKYRTWGRSPVRFMTESLDQDLVSYINDKMLAYYLKQEFGNAKDKDKDTSKGVPKSKSAGALRSVRSKHTVQAKGS
jgi:hypothetical protein